jgi:alkanesulfonate monooxygenase SsuD/methylene tetrahydromethanopterin reductase-like flavin-dependent oxidoreductase (luciferase family)
VKIGILAYINENTAPADAVARRCEELGFESLWLPEHPIMSAGFRPPQTNVSKEAYQDRAGDWYARLPDPFVLLTAAAAATTRIRIATGICLLPEHEPITLAPRPSPRWTASPTAGSSLESAAAGYPK